MRNTTFGSLHVAISLALLNFDSNELIAMANLFSVAVQLLVVETVFLCSELLFVARPTKVPGGMATLYALGMLPLAMFAYMVATAIHNGKTATISIAIVTVGSCYGLFQHRRHRLSL